MKNEDYLIAKKKSGALGKRVVIDRQSIISDLNAANITISLLTHIQKRKESKPHSQKKGKEDEIKEKERTLRKRRASWREWKWRKRRCEVEPWLPKALNSLRPTKMSSETPKAVALRASVPTLCLLAMLCTTT